MSGIAATLPPGAESDSAASAAKPEEVRSPDTATGATLTGSPFSEKKEESDLEGRSPGTGVRLRLEGVLDGAQTKSLDEAKEEILNKFFDADGNYKYIYFIEDDESVSESESEAEKTGGARLTAEEKRTLAEDARTAYVSSMERTDVGVLTGTDTSFDVAERIQQVLATREDHPAMWGLSRNDWETPKAGQQCAEAGNAGRDRPCWLCGNPVGIGQGGTDIAGKRMSVCSPFENQYECEHVLPGVFMLFLKRMVNNTLGADGARDARDASLYDSSCHICNTTKSDGLYIKASWIGPASGEKSLVFSPNNENIMLDVLTFIIATRIGQSVELKRIPASPPAMEGASNYRNRMIAETQAEYANTDPICSNRTAVVTYNATKKGDELVISRSVFTSITAVADRATQETIAAISTALPVSFGERREAAARSAEAAAAFNVARRYNNLTRAVIEQITDAEITAAVQADPPDTQINISRFAYVASNSLDESNLFKTIFSTPPATAIVARTARPVDIQGRIAGPDVEMNAKRITELTNAGIPTAVSRDKAWVWIRRRYLAIWERMTTLCRLLNGDPNIAGYARRLATGPFFTENDITALDAWDKVKVRGPGGPASKRQRTVTGGFRFTIRRRSETRQTKKNRRRRVIEVRV